MGNRFYTQTIEALIKGLTLLHARVLMSGTTPLLQVWVPPGPGQGYGSYANASAASQGFGGTKGGAEGVASVTRTNTGLWTVVLHDNYQRIVGWDAKQVLAGGVSTIIGAGLNSSLTDMTTLPGSTVALALLTAGSGAAAPAAADPADTTSVELTFILSNSTAL